MKHPLAYLILLLCMTLLAGCTTQSPDVEVGYQPPIVPIRVSINNYGEVRAGFSGSIDTPIGTFDIGGSTSVYSLQNEYQNRILIVQVDNEATVYELEQGKEFHVDFDDSNRLYKKVALNYKTNGNIVLELESVKNEDTSNDESAMVQTPAPKPTQKIVNTIVPTKKISPANTTVPSSCTTVAVTLEDTPSGDVLHIQQCSNWKYDLPELAKGVYALDPHQRYVVYCANTGYVYFIKVGDANSLFVENLKEKMPYLNWQYDLPEISFYENGLNHSVIFRDRISGKQVALVVPLSFFK
jgi:hypothetical protein